MFFRTLNLVLVATLALSAQNQPDNVFDLVKKGHTSEKHWTNHSKLIGKPAPKLNLSGWMNGRVKPEDMKGKIVIVDFWATWCGPCIRAIPHNNQLVRKYADKGVLLIGVHGSPGESNMARALKECGITYPIVRTTPGTLNAWKVAYYPTYGIIDRNGILRALGIASSYVDKVVDAILEEQSE